ENRRAVLSQVHGTRCGPDVGHDSAGTERDNRSAGSVDGEYDLSVSGGCGAAAALGINRTVLVHDFACVDGCRCRYLAVTYTGGRNDHVLCVERSGNDNICRNV